MILIWFRLLCFIDVVLFHYVSVLLGIHICFMILFISALAYCTIYYCCFCRAGIKRPCGLGDRYRTLVHWTPSLPCVLVPTRYIHDQGKRRE